MLRGGGGALNQVWECPGQPSSQENRFFPPLLVPPPFPLSALRCTYLAPFPPPLFRMAFTITYTCYGLCIFYFFLVS